MINTKTLVVLFSAVALSSVVASSFFAYSLSSKVKPTWYTALDAGLGQTARNVEPKGSRFTAKSNVNLGLTVTNLTAGTWVKGDLKKLARDEKKQNTNGLYYPAYQETR